MTTKTLAIVGGALIAVMAAAAGTMVLAQEPPPGAPRMRGPGGPGPGGFGGPLGDIGIPLPALNLTDEQKAQVRTVMESHRDATQALMQRLGPAHQAVRAAIETVPVDEALIRAKSAELAAVEADAAVFRATVRSEIFAILTAEQQQQVTELSSRMRRPGPRGGGGPGALMQRRQRQF